MTHSRDDIVIRPNLKVRERSIRERAREERVIAETSSKKGRLGRLIRRRAKMKMASRKKKARGSPRKAPRMGMARAGAGAATRTGGRAALVNPVGIAVAAVVAAIVVATRLLKDEPFETMGSQVKNILLGGATPVALAERDARKRMKANPAITQMLGLPDKHASELQQVFNLFKKQSMPAYEANRLIMDDPDFGVNNPLDMLIIRVKDLIMNWWAGSSGPTTVQKMEDSFILWSLTRYR